MRKVGATAALLVFAVVLLWASGLVSRQDLAYAVDWTRGQAAQFVRNELAAQTHAQHRLGYRTQDTWVAFEDADLERRTWHPQDAYLHMAISYENVAPGLRFGTLSLQRAEGGTAFDLAILEIDPKRVEMRILIDQSKHFSHTTVRDLLRQHGAVAAINASLFDPEGQPLGLVIQDGEERHAANSYAGYFVVRGGEPSIYVDRDGLSTQGVEEALQGYPTLMHNHRVFDYAKQGDRAREIERRSVVAVHPSGTILLLATDVLLDGLSFYELSTILGALGVRDALALDGGRSTQLVVKTDAFTRSITGYDKVPVAIGVFPNSAP